MTEKISKKDFIEIEYTAKLKDNGQIFDTNIKEDAEKAGLKIEDLKPFIFSVGHGMIIKGLDQDIENKEIGKKYISEFKPELAFGKRNPALTRMIPLSIFTEQKIQPQRGMQVDLGGQVAKILSVSGGRILVDFNNPLAGRDVVYEFKINRKVNDLKEKINALQDFFLRKRFDFELKDKDVIFKVPEKIIKFIEVFSKHFEEILGIKIKAEKQEQKAPAPQKKQEATVKPSENPKTTNKEKKE